MKSELQTSGLEGVVGEVRALFRSLGVTEKHPVCGLPSVEQCVGLLGTATGRTELVRILQERERLIGLMESDPLQYGWKPAVWARASALLREYRELLILGGNRSTKTEFAADFAVQDLVGQQNREWAFFHSSADSSVRQQQPRVYKYLPPTWRDLGKVGKSVNVSYTVKNGFSDNVFILPNNSRGYFFNYMQDVKVMEGYELDGAWCDELVPPEFLETVRFRLVTRRGVLLTTFTPVLGYTATVGRYLAGARVEECRRSPLLPGRNVADCPDGEMPFVLRCAAIHAAVILFFTEWNLFNPYEELVQRLKGAAPREVKMRAYGWPEKATGVAFPKFGGVNILKRSEARPMGWMENGLVPARPWEGRVHHGGTEGTERDLRFGNGNLKFEISDLKGAGGALYPGLPRQGTNYVFADPGVAKNWFLKWYRVGSGLEHSFIYREWPDWGTHGAWALPSDKADGKTGPAQRSEFGKGIVQYKRLILEAEGWVWDPVEKRWDGSKAEVIFERYIDPRMGGAEVPSEEEGTSIIALMGEEQVDKDGCVTGPAMEWRPAPGGLVRDGLQLMGDRFDYDERQPVTVLNCPRLYVVEDCAQSIYAFREYTGLDGEKGALKDVIDPDRYFVKSDVGYVEPGSFGSVGGGSY